MQPTRLTPSQTAELLEVTTRTLRRYSSILSVALSPSAAQAGRKRFYSGSDVEILRRAQKMMKDGMALKEIATVLPVVPAGDDESTSLTLSPEQNMALGAVVERARQLTDELSDQGDQLTDQDERLKRLEEWYRLPWYRRIFGGPK